MLLGRHNSIRLVRFIDLSKYVLEEVLDHWLNGLVLESTKRKAKTSLDSAVICPSN